MIADEGGGPPLDMDPAAFRAAAHAVVDVMADYLEGIEARPVFPAIEPGSLRPLFPTAAPEAPEPIDAILADYRALIEPNATHWQHPGFLAYFATTASGPGILGEMLTAVIGQNAMLWRTSPIGTELEEVVVDWLRQALGLPAAFDGLLTDTASTSTLIALAAARETAGTDASARGLAGRDDLGAGLRVYASSEAHSSIEKACTSTLRLGRAPHSCASRSMTGSSSCRARWRPRSSRTARSACVPSRSSRPSAQRPPRRSIPWRPSPRSPSAKACGSTSMPPMPARSRSCPTAAHPSMAGSGPIRSWSIRTNGCSRRSTPRSS